MSIFSPVHIVFFAVIALLVLGPRRFPEFTRALGHGVREFRDVLNGEFPRRREVDEGQDVAAGDEATAGEMATVGEAAAAGDEATAGSTADTSASDGQ
jgi:Sec-independent protein translocase protein TatA